MKEIRNSDNKLVAMYEETTFTIVIVRRECETRICFRDDGALDVKNEKHDLG